MVQKKQSKTKQTATNKNTEKSVSASNAKKEQQPSSDALLLEDTLKLLETLNKKVTQVESAKKKLDLDIEKLSKRVETKESSSSANKKENHSSLIDLLKKELLNEFHPLISRFNLKSIKVDMYKEIERVLDVELEKLRSEISHKQTRTKREFTKRLSTLESRLVDALRTNEYLAEELRNFEKNQVNSFSTEISQRLDKAIASAYSKINVSLDKSHEELDNVSKKILSFSKKISLFSKDLEQIKEQVNASMKHQDIDIGGLEAKISKLDKELKQVVKTVSESKTNTPSIDRKEVDAILNPKIKLLEKDISLVQEKLSQIEHSLHNKLSVSFSKKFSESLEELRSSILKEREVEQEFLATKFNENVEAVELSVKQNLQAFEKEFADLKISLDKEISKRIEDQFVSTYMTANQTLKSSSKNIDELKKNLSQTDLKLDSLSNMISHMKGELTTLSKNQGLDLSSIESKVLKLEKEFKGLSSLVERYEDDLYSKKKQEVLEIEKSCRSALSSAEKKLSEVKSGKDEIENFVVDKFNSLVDSINAFEDRVVAVEKLSEKKIEKELTSRINSTLNSFFKEIESKQLVLSKQQSSSVEKFLSSMREEFEAVVKDFRRSEDKDIKQLTTDLQSLKSKVLLFEKNIKPLTGLREELRTEREKEQEFLAQKYNQSVDTLQKSFQEDLTQFAKDFENLKLKFDEEYAKQVVNYNNLTVKLSDVIKDYESKLADYVEKKFEFVEEEFKDKVKQSLVDLTKSFKDREDDYFSKIDSISAEKEQLVSELEDFKLELSSNTKSFVESLHDEVEKLRVERQQFEEDEKKYLQKLETLSHAKEVSLNETYEQLKKSLDSFIEQKDKTFKEHEETFRDLFVEKVTNLHEYFSKKLSTIESKFIDKTIKRVDARVDSVHREFMLIEDKLSSQQKELDLKIDQVEKHEMAFYENIEAHRKKLEEKVEQRLIDAEKHYNKRFLDYDSLFSTFKGVIVDEVEGLIRDVEKLTSSKLTELENKGTKLNFILKDSDKILNEYKGIETFIQEEIKDVRDELNDLRVKVDLFDYDQTQQGMSGMIKVMSEYEQQLEGLILSLKKQGMESQKILSLLTTKGHPKLYVKMMLSDLFSRQQNFM